MGQGYSTTLANQMLNGIRGVTFANAGCNVQLHVDNPGPEGVDNIASGSTARIPVTLTEASGGAIRTAHSLLWTNTGNAEAITYVSVFNDAGQFLWSAQLNPLYWSPGGNVSITSIALALTTLATDG